MYARLYDTTSTIRATHSRLVALSLRYTAASGSNGPHGPVHAPMNSPLSLLTALRCAVAVAQTPPVAARPRRLRSTIEKDEGNSVTVKELGGAVISLVLADKQNASGGFPIFPIALAAIRSGSSIGTAAMPRADASLDARELPVLPEAAAGNGEDHRLHDLQTVSTMTHATVADLVAARTGRPIRLRVKDGGKIVNPADTTPVVLFKPGDRALQMAGGPGHRDGRGPWRRADCRPRPRQSRRVRRSAVMWAHRIGARRISARRRGSR